MNEQVEQILSVTSTETLTMVARSIIGDDSAALAGDPVFTDIDTSHNDARTIGIVKVSGAVVSVRNGGHHVWSAVVKVIDTHAPPDTAAIWVSPENETKIYELGLFIDDGLPLRPAKCFRVETKNNKYVKAAWGSTSVEVGLELVLLLDELLEKAKEMPHGLAFGDSHSRNMFPVGSSTIGIDWEGMSYEPIGCDAGVLAGSAFTFGLEEAERAVDNEPIVFDSYMTGLESVGWEGERDQVRIGYLAQFLGYFGGIGNSPIWLFENESRRPYMEHRLGAKLEDIPGRMEPMMALFPKYVEELKQLLDRAD
jgi:hypothetical protein